MTQLIRVRGIGGEADGKVWEACDLLRIGRLETLEIALDDGSVSRRHAEVRATERGWRVRDLKSTNGTFLNGSRLNSGESPIRSHDILRCGNITLVVDDLAAGPKPEVSPEASGELIVEATACVNWEEALQGLAFDRDRSPRAGEQLLALFRAGHHLVHIDSEEALLQSILHDAVAVLDAQRGAIVLAEGADGPLQLQALATNNPDTPARPAFSQSLAQRSFNRGESILCNQADEDPELAGARSIADGAMASVLCVLLRTPRRRLGVLHLDRGPWQKPFTQDDLYLADALAANVSAGIECARLLQRQQDLFLKTIAMLAQAVEMRDVYTGGHTARVTTYSVLLAKHLNVSPADLQLIRIGTPLHDIGKIGIDDAILRKPGKLTPEEFRIMQLHTVKGAAILATLPDLKPVIPIVRNHHERWDGKGYPDGLKGEETSRLARIVAVADAFDAMASDRPYRVGLPVGSAFAEVEKMSGQQFDPECAAAFLNIRDQVAREMQVRMETVNNLAVTARVMST